MASTEHVAFFVTLEKPITTGKPGAPLLFDTLVTNVGTGYDVITGKFTAPVTGVYLFTFSVNKYVKDVPGK